MMRLLFAAAVGCLVAATAMAQDAPAPATAPDAKAEKKICRRESVTGSYLGANRVCHTKAEWAEIDAKHEQDTQRFSDQNRQANGVIGQ
jgi:hypothetical protein